MSYIELIDKERVPQHIAIIMDGNGRWAQQRGLPRTDGHQAGAAVVRRIAEDAVELGVRNLTLYTFSTENWNRPTEEVAALMVLLFDSMEEEIFIKNNIRFAVIGEMDKLPERVRERFSKCMERTAGNTRMTFVLAISYSAKWEITEAARNIARLVQQGKLQPEDIDDKLIDKHLTTSFMPDPELLIRTGREQRLSNFLLWQCAYSELYFSEVMWPEFDKEELCKAIYSYQQRQRRFGKTGEQVTK
ncbi:MAG: isoprenyl transferase [Bacteroidaceae bacterium]|nr:isoprenyl transferase [Bacteroidaceae bacterium]